MSARGNLWVIVLAGGDGARLLGMTICGQRLNRPKQFCRMGEEKSLLRAALDRGGWLTEPARIVPVVCDPHRQWWEAETAHLPADNVLAQPSNKGNALAILHALIHVLQRDADPLVAVLPSDHAVEEEEPLIAALRSAIRTVSERREQVVLLGVPPDQADAEYGWILPARGEPGDALPVSAFVEKPPIEKAAELMRQGAVWNSFIFAGTGLGLIQLYGQTRPDLLQSYLENMIKHGWRAQALGPLYQAVEAADFSREVLERATDRLRVLTVKSCGWTDLGTPTRVRAWLEHRASRRPAGGRGLDGLGSRSRQASLPLQHAV